MEDAAIRLGHGAPQFAVSEAGTNAVISTTIVYTSTNTITVSFIEKPITVNTAAMKCWSKQNSSRS